MSGEPPLCVSSELYEESAFVNVRTLPNSNSMIELAFRQPSTDTSNKTKPEVDDDGDLLVQRRKCTAIRLEFSSSTTLPLVGLQLWKGAFLLSDFILSNAQIFQEKTVLELGSGVGFTGIVAGTIAKKVYCTDIDHVDILEMIRRNVAMNRNLTKSSISVFPLDFRQRLNHETQDVADSVEIVISADVIYDNDITEDFVKCLTAILMRPPKKIFFLAVEKRYVFTVEDLEASAPCYEYFVKYLRSYWRSSEVPPQASSWIVSQVALDFPQFFDYARSKELVLLKIET